MQSEALQDIPFHLPRVRVRLRCSQNRCLGSMWGRLSNTVTASTFERFVATRTKCGCLRASARGQPNQHTRVQSVPIERGGSPNTLQGVKHPWHTLPLPQAELQTPGCTIRSPNHFPRGTSKMAVNQPPQPQPHPQPQPQPQPLPQPQPQPAPVETGRYHFRAVTW